MSFVERSFCVLFLSVSAAFLPAAAAQEKETYILDIVKPAPGETLRGLSSIEVSFTGKFADEAKEEPLMVVLTWGDTVHYHLIDPDAHENSGGSSTIRDPYFPAIEGPHTLSAELRSLDGEDPLLSKEVYFSVAAPEGDQDIQAIRDQLDLQAFNLDNQKNGLATSTLYANLANRDPRTDDWAKKSADNLLWAATQELRRRVDSYCRLSQSFEGRFDTKKALQALEYAEEIYEAEAKAAHMHPHKGKTSGIYGWRQQLLQAPAHFEAFAEFSARRGNPDTAGAWLMKAAEFYEEMAADPTLLEKDKEMSWSWAAQIYRKIASITFLLTSEIELYKEWMERAEEAEQKGKKPPA